MNYFRRSVHRVNAISRHDWLGWLAETGYAAANPNRGTARRETGQLEPELCYRGAGPGRRRGFTWTAGEIRRPTLHVKYCTIKCRTHRSQSIPPYLQSPLSPPLLSLSLQRRLASSFATPSLLPLLQLRLLLGFFKDPLCWKLG